MEAESITSGIFAITGTCSTYRRVYVITRENRLQEHSKNFTTKQA